MSDMTFTAGLNVQQFEKGLARIQELGRRAAVNGNVPGVGGAGGLGGKGGADLAGTASAVLRFATFQKAARAAFGIASEAVKAYADENDAAAARIKRLDESVHSLQVSLGRDLMSSGLIDGLRGVVEWADKARTSIVNWLADSVGTAFGGDGKASEQDRALKADEELQARIKAIEEVRQARMRLNAETADTRGDKVQATQIREAQKYEEELKRIAQIKGATSQEQQSLRALAASRRDAAILAAQEQAQAQQARAQREREQEAERADREDQKRVEEGMAKRAAAIEMLDKIAVESARARGQNDEADKLEVMLAGQERLKTLSEATMLTAFERARAEDAVRTAMQDQVDAIDRTAAQRAAANANQAEKAATRLGVGSGQATAANIAQVLGAGVKATQERTARGIEKAVEILNAIRTNTGRDAISVWGP